MKMPLLFEILLHSRKKRPKHCNAPHNYYCNNYSCKTCRYKKHKTSGCFIVAFFILLFLYILTEFF